MVHAPILTLMEVCGMVTPCIGLLQGRLTPSAGRGIQFFPFENWQNEFPIAKEIGFSAIELLVKRDSYAENPLWSDEGVEEIINVSKGIAIPSVHAFFDKGVWYTEAMLRLMENAHRVGATTVLVSFFDDNVLVSKEDMRFACMQLAPVLSVARELSMRIGIETEMEAEKLVDFISSFRSPAVGVYYDIGNMVSMGIDVERDISILSDLIVGVHVKDRIVGGKSVPLGEGSADFPTIFRALKDVGYTGPFIIQGARWEGTDDVTLCAEYRNLVSSWLTETYGGDDG